MKTTLIKAKQILLIATISLPVLFNSCKKDNDENNAVTEEEAAEAMAQAVDPASGGLVVQTSYAIDASVIKAISANCGISKDTSMSISAGTPVRSYTYNLNWNRMLACNATGPSRFDFSFSGNNTYAGPYMSSADQSTGTFIVTGLEPSATQFNVNETYTRNGTQQSKVRGQRTFTSLVEIKTTNLTVNKSTQEIISGTASVTIKGNASTGEAFSYSGTLTFNGGHKATIVTGKGNTYTIQW